MNSRQLAEQKLEELKKELSFVLLLKESLTELESIEANQDVFLLITQIHALEANINFK